MLDRYKKRGGFMQLLNLIEGFPKAKQDQFLSMIAQESHAWEAQLRSRILLFEHIIAWNPTVLGEIISRIQPLVLATAVHGLSKDMQVTITRYVNPTDRRQFEEFLSEKTPSAGEVATCRMRFVAETRTLLSTNVIRLEKYLPHMIIPENIEETLQSETLNESFAVREEEKDAPPTAVRAAPSIPHETHGHQEDVTHLKKTLQQALQENANLKSEVQNLRHKLDQIRKIA